MTDSLVIRDGTIHTQTDSGVVGGDLLVEGDEITARIGSEAVPVGPLELQIAYKLHLGARTDIEDAVHLYTLFEESLSVPRLKRWVRRLDVNDEYERLERA